jgi:hypothetical protein
MANLDFYATIEDHEAVLAELYGHGDLRIFQSYSEFDSDLKEYARPDQILQDIKQATHSRHAVLLQLWAPAVSSAIEIKRFPISVEGFSYRHRIAGWGLMQLYLSKESEAEIYPSHFGHFSQRGAESRSGLPSSQTNPGSAEDWDWQSLIRISRRIQQIIRRLAETKVGSKPALKAATRLLLDASHRAAN